MAQCPSRRFVQNCATSGASGITVPRPTIAMSSGEAWGAMASSVVWLGVGAATEIAAGRGVWMDAASVKALCSASMVVRLWMSATP